MENRRSRARSAGSVRPGSGRSGSRDLPQPETRAVAGGRTVAVNSIRLVQYQRLVAQVASIERGAVDGSVRTTVWETSGRSCAREMDHVADHPGHRRTSRKSGCGPGHEAAEGGADPAASVGRHRGPSER